MGYGSRVSTRAHGLGNLNAMVHGYRAAGLELGLLQVGHYIMNVGVV